MSSHRAIPRSYVRLKSQAGFGLIEVMIAAAIISIIALGLSTIFADMFKVQNKNTAVASIRTMKQIIEATIQNGDSWTAMSQDATAATGNPEMTCLRPSGAACPKTTNAPLNVRLNTGGEVFFSRTATRGFTTSGVLCNEFSTSTPSLTCVFRYDLRWTPVCNDTGPNCALPAIMITGTLLYSAPEGSNLIGGINPANYAISLQRGAEALKNEAVIVAGRRNGTTGESTGVGCFNTWVARELNTIVSDTGGNVSLAANRVTLKAGVYNCRIQAPGFKNGGNRIRVRRVSGGGLPTIESGVYVASVSGGSSVNASIETTLILNADTTFVVEHTCTARPSQASYGSTNNAWMLGVPIPIDGSYTNVTYTTVSCVRSS